MEKVYKKDGTSINLLTEGDYTVKSYEFTMDGINHENLVGSNEELGINADKVVISPYISAYRSIPSTPYFFINLKWQYKTNIYVYSDVIQKLTFIIEWIERK